MTDIDPATSQWRENFTRLFESEARRTHESLQSITNLLEKQNNRVRKNELELAGMKTWITLIGGVTGLTGIAVALLQAMK